jgi:hypothetical protein
MPTGILNQFSVNFYTSPVANFNVNGSIGSCSTWKDVYNCSSASMTLANTSTGTSGNSPQYQLLIYNYTQSTCAIGSVIYNNGAATNVTPGWTSGWPTTLNMKTLTGINGNSWFNATGYYLVRLNVRNSCNTPGYTTKDEIIKVSPSPESISASWSAFNCANTVAPSLNCNAPTAVSKYSPIIYASNTGTGSNPGASIDQYTVTIQDYSGPSCILGGVYYSHTYSWAGPGPLTNKLISLNKVIEESGGGTSWFANHFSTKVKVTISVHNVCGNSPDVIGYLTNSIECRVGSKTELNTNLSIFPNPARGSVTLHIELEKATDVNCKLIDYTGRTVQQLLIGDYLEQGNHDIYVDVSGLSRGIYFIELTDEKKQMLKLVLE